VPDESYHGRAKYGWCVIRNETPRKGKDMGMRNIMRDKRGYLGRVLHLK